MQNNNFLLIQGNQVAHYTGSKQKAVFEIDYNEVDSQSDLLETLEYLRTGQYNDE